MLLKIQSTIDAISILQNEIDIAPTPTNALPIIGDVLTDKSAKKSNNVIFVFINILKL